MPRMPRLPRYCKHKPQNRAYVRWKPFFGSKQHYLEGDYGSPESIAEYERILARIRQAGVTEPPATKPAPKAATVSYLYVAYDDAVGVTKSADWKQRFAAASRPLIKAYGQSLCADFGPLKLQDVRDAMRAKGWGCYTVNSRVNLLKEMFRWGATREMFPASVYGALQVVAPLKPSDFPAKPSAPRKPATSKAIMSVLPHVTPLIGTMIRVQFLCGMRSEELCRLRACEIDRSGEVWIYSPSLHKTAHRGKSKIICFGPKAKELLTPYLGKPDEFVFTPAKSIAEDKSRRAAERKTKLYGAAKKRKPKERRTRPRYTSRTYFKALRYGFLRLAHSLGHEGKPPKGYSLRKWLAERGIEYWHPHLLRHTRATKTRAVYNLEGSAAQLGNTLTATQIYAQQSLALAVRIARETG